MSAIRETRWTRRPMFFLGLIALAVFANIALQADSAAATPPNVIIILSDDQRQPGTMDSPAMAKTKGWFQTGSVPGYGTTTGGTFFPNGVVSTPLCCPARASIFSGRYGHNNGVNNNNDIANNPNALDTSKTLEAYLHAQGYHSGLFGKYLNGWTGDLPNSPRQWDEWSVGEGQYFPVRTQEGTFGGSQNGEKTIMQYSTDYYADRAVNFVNSTPASTPYFLYLAPSAPHAPFTPDQQFANTPVDPFSPLPASWMESDRTDKPFWVRNTFSDPQFVLDKRIDQIRMLYSLDNAVDDVMRAATTHDQNNGTSTIAFFLSDNGMHWGEHGLQSKASPYSESVGVPYYLRWPGHVSSNQTSQAVASSIDVAPTAIEAAGAPAPSTPFDGRSLLSTPAPNRLFIEGNGGVTADSRRFISIRTPTFTYIETPPASGEPEFREYYDRTRDPAEISDLLHDSDPTNDPPTENTDPGVDSLHEMVRADAVCGGTGCPGADSATFPADTKITSAPDANTNKTTARFVFTSSVPNSTFECALDSAPFLTCPTALPGQSWPYTIEYPGLGQGSHTFKVRASAPPGGSPDPSPAIHQWTIDSTPDTSIDSKPPKLSNNPNPSFTFSSTSGSSFTCELVGPSPAGPAPCSSSSSQSYSSLADGDYTFKVNVQGDTTPAKYDWTIDATAPAPGLGGQPPGGVELASHDVHLFRCVVGCTDYREPLQCSTDYGAFYDCGAESDLTGLSDGSHSIRWKATDFAGNTTTSDPKTFSVNAAPTYDNAPDEGWPDITANGDSDSVEAVISDGADGWFVGGNFQKVGGLDHTNIAHIKSDKSVDQGWNASANLAVNTMALGSNGKLYIGGAFTTVNGQSHVRIAALNASDGTLVSGWNGSTDNVVRDIALNGTSSAYIVGSFGTVGGSTHKRVAEINLADGSPTSWGQNLNIDSSVSGSLDLRAVALAPGSVSPSSVFVGGAGTISQGSTATTTKANLAQLDRTGSGSIVNNPQVPETESGSEVDALAVSPDQGGMLVGGRFNQALPTYSCSPTPCRRSAFELRFTGTSPAGWNPIVRIVAGVPVAGATIRDFSVADLTPFNPTGELRWSIVAGGSFNDIRADYTRTDLAELPRLGWDDANDGYPTDFNPPMDASQPTGQRPILVNDTAMSGQMLAVAGKFSAFAFDQRRDLAFFKDPAPETTITGHIGQAVTGQHTQIFTFSSSEDHGTFECSIDSGTYYTCGSGSSDSEAYLSLNVGDHTFSVRARDARGTVDPSPDTYSWTVQDFANSPESGWPYIGTGNAVRAIVADGNGGWYVGGDFSMVCDAQGTGTCDTSQCDAAHHCHVHHDVVHINPNKSVDDNWSPSVDPVTINNGVRALALSAATNTLYVGGSFTSVNSNGAFSKLAAIDTTTGGVLSWDPNVTNWVYGLALSGNNTIYAGGTLNFVNGVQRSKLAEIDLTTANATSWNPNVTNGPGGNAQVWAIAMSSTKLYAGGASFGDVGGQTNTGNLVEIDRATGAASNWKPTPNAPIEAIALRSSSPSTVSVAGMFTSISGQTRNHYAEINLDSSATATSWNPNADANGWTLTHLNNTTLVGGSYTHLGSDSRLHLGQTLNDGTASGWQPSLNSAPFALTTQTVSGRVTLAVGGVFTDTGHTYFAVYGPPDF